MNENETGITLTASTYYVYDRERMPDYIRDFDAETKAKLAQLESVRDEIAIRIYGADATYSEVDDDINAMLKGVL